MSELLKLNYRDILKGAFLSVVIAVLTLLYEMIQGNQVIELKKIGLVATGAFLAYLIKNLNTDENGKLLGKF